MRKVLRLAAFALVICALPTAAFTQQEDGQALAKKVANPISDLVSVPFQMNWDTPVGPNDQTRFLLNLQPVMPFTISEDWNLVARIIAPFLSQPSLAPGAPADSGLSDILASLFFSPREGAVMWGVGPVISLPSTSQPTLGTEKWAAGPTAVIVRQQSGWTYGALWNELWSFAGNKSRGDVSQLFVQPFCAYTTQTLWTITLSSESTANWYAAGGERWTVPIIFAASKLSSFGTFPASYQFGGGTYVARPDDTPEWKARFAITILLPRRK